MKAGWGAAVGLLMIVGTGAEERNGLTQRLVPAPGGDTRYVSGVWPSTPPPDCPLERSERLAGLRHTGRHRVYTRADTWYPSWAADGMLYSPWTDGSVSAMRSSSGPRSWTTGQARIEGDDPMDLEVIPLGLHHAPALPYGGRYPCGTLVHNGTWYYGTYCLAGCKYAWDVMGPFLGFRSSRDGGKTWKETPCTPSQPLFPEAQGMPATTRPPKPTGHLAAHQVRSMGKVKMGSPHVVDFGQNMVHSPDGKMYLTGHGATRADATCSWVSGDQVYLARVTPTPGGVNDLTRYEFFAGHDNADQPVWVKNFGAIKPLLEWQDRLGCVTVTYNPGLKRYMMCVTDGGESGRDAFDTMLLEAERITGPWRLVVFLEQFGKQAYFVNIPSKFIASNGRTMWLCFAANWVRTIPSDPPDARYGMCLYEVALLAPEEMPGADSTGGEPQNLLAGPANLARLARATASSSFPQCPPAGAINGIVGGLPGRFADEWSADGEHVGAWIRLSWDRPQRVDRVWLFDRPSPKVQVTAAQLRFSDGSTIAVEALQNDARRGREVRFPARTVDWLEVRVTATRDDHPYIGFSEIAVFGLANE